MISLSLSLFVRRPFFIFPFPAAGVKMNKKDIPFGQAAGFL